jgi:hypothetical protein
MRMGTPQTQWTEFSDNGIASVVEHNGKTIRKTSGARCVPMPPCSAGTRMRATTGLAILAVASLRI